MNIKILRILLIILLFGIFGIIFNFSSQNGEESKGLSRKITETITKNIKWIQELEQEEKEKIVGKIEKVIRKLAHFSLYAVVGVISMSLMSTYELKQNKRAGISLAIGIIYAISDELHQWFIAGRAASTLDVMIDTCGVVFGISFIWIALSIVKKHIIM